ncbi:MAG TPA: purine-nucleoside phosphorylase [Candidatus Omnitrophota bacterium]|jgi:purine-nucleoside phosphorylase|nr:purine-nucleoside phosphorylase [Candidatus Omnitrophota bacterium]
MAQAGSTVVSAAPKGADDLPRRIEEARAFVASRSAVRPEVAVILGTGLGRFAEAMPGADVIPFEEIPGFPTTAVESHAGDLVLGTLGGKPTAVLNGRAHYYEGWTMDQVVFPVRVTRALGARTLIATNAAGGMNPLYRPSDIVAIVDHINLMGDNPLIGRNHDSLGPRFPDMSEPYDRSLIALAHEVALEERIALQSGVLVGVAGPNLETRAEYRFLRWAGADLVSMSLVPEAIAAVHGGMRVLAFAVVTDLCLPDALEAVDIPKILAHAAKAEPLLTRLVTRVLERMPAAVSDAENPER